MEALFAGDAVPIDTVQKAARDIGSLQDRDIQAFTTKDTGAKKSAEACANYDCAFRHCG